MKRLDPRPPPNPLLIQGLKLLILIFWGIPTFILSKTFGGLEPETVRKGLTALGFSWPLSPVGIGILTAFVLGLMLGFSFLTFEFCVWMKAKVDDPRLD